MWLSHVLKCAGVFCMAYTGHALAGYALVGMGAASVGLLPPVAGAIFQELIDLAAVLNALRAAFPAGRLSDYGEAGA